MTILWEVPSLDIDKVLGKPTPNVKLERRIVWNLLHVLEAAGFHVVNVEDRDGVDYILGSHKEYMEILFNAEDSFIYARKDGFEPHVISLINGNGVDVISDWSWSGDGDADGFRALMDNFNPEDYA